MTKWFQDGYFYVLRKLCQSLCKYSIINAKCEKEKNNRKPFACFFPKGWSCVIAISRLCIAFFYAYFGSILIWLCLPLRKQSLFISRFYSAFHILQKVVTPVAHHVSGTKAPGSTPQRSSTATLCHAPPPPPPSLTGTMVSGIKSF